MLLVALNDLERHPRHGAFDMRSSDCEAFAWRAIQIDACDLGQLSRKPRAKGTRVEQRLERRDIEPLEPHVDDWSRRELAAGRGGQGAKRKPHRGASPLAAASSSGTRSIEPACLPCLANHATTSAALGAATSTSSP